MPFGRAGTVLPKPANARQYKAAVNESDTHGLTWDDLLARRIPATRAANLMGVTPKDAAHALRAAKMALYGASRPTSLSSNWPYDDLQKGATLHDAHSNAVGQTFSDDRFNAVTKQTPLRSMGEIVNSQIDKDATYARQRG